MRREVERKDLVYTRTPTDAKLRVEMGDGRRWEIPVQVIADSRDEHYARHERDEEDTIGSIRDGRLDESEIRDWAGNNMNWSDVMPYASQVPSKAKKVDWEDGWSNGEKEIVGSI